MWTAIMSNPTLAYKSNKFRQSFHLNYYDKQLIKEQGYLALEKHAHEIVTNSLKIKPSNDGKQTPFRGHPLFKAQHATACCCRKCIQKFHKIPQYQELNNQSIQHIVNQMMTWIRKEMKCIS